MPPKKDQETDWAAIIKAAQAFARTPEGKKRAREYKKRIAQEARDKKNAIKNVVKVLREGAKSHGGTRIDVVFGDIMAQHDCPTLYMEWMTEIFWGNIFSKTVLPRINTLYDKIVNRRLTAKKPYNFNDLDDDVWYEPHKKMAVICHTTQNVNVVYMWEKSESPDKIHVRRFWDEYKLNKKDKFDFRDDEDFKKNVAKLGRAQAIRHAEVFVENWSDDIAGNPYPQRPSLEMYRKNGFKPRYGDFRDGGYILTWDSFENKIQGAHSSFGLIKTLTECFFPCLCSELLGHEMWPRSKGFTTWPKEKREV